MPEDTFKYRVELDTQGLSAQLAAVRDVVSQGLTGAAETAAAGIGVAGAATNQLSNDLIRGQQLLMAAMPAQLAPLNAMGAARMPLAQIPGMPQTAGEELMAAVGLGRPPVGVFPAQFQAVAQMRLQERAQMAAGGIAQGVIGGLGGGALGAAIGSMVLPGPGTIIGGLVGSIGGDAIMQPFIGSMQDRMMERARTTQIFGFNQFSSDQRATTADFMRQRFTSSIFNEEEFNSVLPAAVRAGFFRGVGRGDTQMFQQRFQQAEEQMMAGQFLLGVTGSEGLMVQAELRRGFRRLGVRDPGAVNPIFARARELSRQMAEMGDFIDPTELIQDQLQVGQAALQFGISPQRAMEVTSSRTAMMNRLIAEGSVTGEDLAMLGGSAGEAAQRLAMTQMNVARQPVMRAMALAFASSDPMTGRARINEQALEQLGTGRISFAALSERMAQQAGLGQGGTTDLMTRLANQQKLQSDLMVNQGQVMRGLTDDFLRQANLDVTDGTRMFVMQKVFGVGEAESRALVQGLPIERAERKRLEEGAQQQMSDVESAIQTQRDSIAQSFSETMRDIKDGIGGFLDDQTRKLTESIVPPLEGAQDRLGSIDERLRNMGGFRSNSPISVGPIIQSPDADVWMHPKDPDTLQGYRSVRNSRVFPAAALPEPMRSPMLPIMSGVSSHMIHRETEAS